MYKEYIVTYERSNLEDNNFIELASFIGVEMNQDFIENEIFHHCGGNYNSSDYGKGKVFIFKNVINDEMLFVNTYLSPRDQFQIMEIGVRCMIEKSSEVYRKLVNCFENERLRPIEEKITELNNNFIKLTSSSGKVKLSDYDIGRGLTISLEVVIG